MKLYYSNTSPYSRKVRLVAREKGLESLIEAKMEEVLVNPFSDDKDGLIAANPLGKIPTLLLDNGTALYDSSVICEYLDSLTDNPMLIPTKAVDNSVERFNILRWQATADGMTDAAYNLVMESRRATEDQSQQWMSNWSTEITRVLAYIESHINELNTSDHITLAHLALASAISYLEFRLPENLTDSVGSNTMDWYESFKTRPAMQDTVLHDVAS